eukprot:354809-Pelagomonas_calceolata.AAC.3
MPVGWMHTGHAIMRIKPGGSNGAAWPLCLGLKMGELTFLLALEFDLVLDSSCTQRAAMESTGGQRFIIPLASTQDLSPCMCAFLQLYGPQLPVPLTLYPPCSCAQASPGPHRGAHSNIPAHSCQQLTCAQTPPRALSAHNPHLGLACACLWTGLRELSTPHLGPQPSLESHTCLPALKHRTPCLDLQTTHMLAPSMS